MGYIRHHALVVTSWGNERLNSFLAHAAECELLRCSNAVHSAWNYYWTVLVSPDGSKEGWEESDVGDRERAGLVAWLDDQRYPDGGSSFKWALVQYGDDECETRIVDHSEAEERRQVDPGPPMITTATARALPAKTAIVWAATFKCPDCATGMVEASAPAGAASFGSQCSSCGATFTVKEERDTNARGTVTVYASARRSSEMT